MFSGRLSGAAHSDLMQYIATWAGQHNHQFGPNMEVRTMNMKVVLPVFLLLASSVQGQDQDKKGQNQEPATTEPSLRQELLAMEKEDQQVRAAVLKALGEKGISPGKPITDPALLKIFLEQSGKMAAVDQRSRARLKEVVNKHGWPGKSLVGKEGAHAAWL